jgi:hypothetical protein
LQAIVKCLHDEVQWPNVGQHQLVSTNDGIFHGCISISIMKEFEIEKHGNPMMERKASVARKKIGF